MFGEKVPGGVDRDDDDDDEAEDEEMTEPGYLIFMHCRYYKEVVRFNRRNVPLDLLQYTGICVSVQVMLLPRSTPS